MTRRALLWALPAGWLGTSRALVAQTSLADVEQRIFDEVNRVRSEHAVAPVIWNDLLAGTAREHSRQMAERGFFAHNDPHFGSVGARLKRAHVAYQRCGENLFCGGGRDYEDIVPVAVEGWVASPGHYANLLNPYYTDSGMGVAVSPSGMFYATQIFALPAQTRAAGMMPQRVSAW